ncbi:MAG: DUF6893 family small protein [Candidatus Dormibacter sp.]
MPVWLLVVLALIVLAVLIVLLVSLNDIRRYLRIRNL